MGNKMTITKLDIWLEKIRRGWSLDDVPNEAIKEAVKMELHKDYEKYIKHSKEGALILIKDLCVGYDGYNTIPELKRLIDELRAIALLGLKQKE